ncbi:hypothetical protein M2311_004026 [Rhizobium leguminosarum]|jgi:adenylate cyclase|nr:hypothetical protein [Rhizobium leguminosarum]MDH6273926.1 hypothetical protein [Rhizobium leguminosarum]
MLSPGRTIFNLAVMCLMRMAPDEILQAIVVFDDWESCQNQPSIGSFFFWLSQAMDCEI